MSLAWLQATAPAIELRSGTDAVQLARSWLKLTENRDPLAWDVLAAAQAESGDFNAAIQSADEALARSGKLPPGLSKAIRPIAICIADVNQSATRMAPIHNVHRI